MAAAAPGGKDRQGKRKGHRRMRRDRDKKGKRGKEKEKSCSGFQNALPSGSPPAG